jgi:uncharacterized protein YukE
MSALGNIDIQPGELRGLAQSIEQQRNNLNTQFNSIAARMNSLEQEGWRSESGRALRERFSKLRGFYENKYPPAMNSYVQFLNQTAADYEQTEAQRLQDVANLSNMGQ